MSTTPDFTVRLITGDLGACALIRFLRRIGLKVEVEDETGEEPVIAVVRWVSVDELLALYPPAPH